MTAPGVDTLTVELLSEELPPKALPRLSVAFADGIANGLRTRGFSPMRASSNALRRRGVSQ